MKIIKLLFLVLLFSLISCNENYYDGNVHYFSSHQFHRVDENVFIINSKDMLEEYLLMDTYNELNVLYDTFNEEYFNNNSIIIIHIVESSGSNSLKVKLFEINAGLLDIIVRRNTPGPGMAGTCDIKYHHIIVETTKEEALSIKDYNLKIVQR